MSVKMATQESDGEILRQRFQEKLAARLNADPSSASGQDDTPELDAREPSKSASPFCFQNLLWLVVALMVFYFSDFFRVMMYDLRIKRIWYWIGIAMMSIHIGTAAFLVIWLGYWKKISSEHWDKKYPKAIPIATASFLVGILCLSVALWPVWGFLAPIILLSLFMGVVIIVAMMKMMGHDSGDGDEDDECGFGDDDGECGNGSDDYGSEGVMMIIGIFCLKWRDN
ncbi:transmembrane protein 128-like [Plakobranchus ocellatus]|uniref:Transmembrane protein 128-like n=1 Tax=Plakobranchus ocellatus TaxID=259542 RepID=A0AAV3XVG8_9GAST|nr:transmembrane protein 128-like [Plakobranchus ocellatus]